jgi:diguanylate cyclase (GGDEF)-like protein
MPPSSDNSADRLKWVVLFLTISAITIFEAYHYWLAKSILSYLVSWVLWVILAIWATLKIFHEIFRIQDKHQKQMEEIYHRSRRQDALIQFGTRLSTSLDEQQVCQLVTDELKNTFGFETANLLLTSKPSKLNSNVEKINNTSDGKGEQPGSTHADSLTNNNLTTSTHATRIIAPLRVGNELLGNLIVEHSGGRPFSPQELSVVYSVADQASLAIQNARRWTEQQQKKIEAELRQKELYVRERYLTMLNKITQNALRGQSYPDLLQTSTVDLVELFAADGGLLALWDEERKLLVPTVASRAFRQLLNNGQILPTDVAIALSVLNDGRARIFRQDEDPGKDTPLLLTRLQCHLVLALPLVADDQKLGVVFIAFQSTGELSTVEIGFGEQATSQIALGIAKTRALSMAQSRAKELDALQRATAALLATIELEELLGQILDAAMSATPAASKGSLYLMAPETGQLQIRAAQGYSDPRIRLFKPTSSESYSAQAVRFRRPLLIDDVRNENDKQSSLDLSDTRPVLSLIVAPLLLADKALGAIELCSYNPNDFTQSDLHLLVSFAATATTAINNAQLHAEVQKQAVTDTLTGLYNRRGMFEFGDREVLRSQRFGRPLSAILFDIDQFKEINDTHGHLAGDKILAWVSTQFLAELRAVDLIARYGGDEFLALLSETGLTDAHLIAERICSKTSQIGIPISEQMSTITLSAGVAALEVGDDLQKLIERADRGLYKAKQSGKNRVVVEFPA